MRVIAFDRFRDGVTLKTIEPYLDEDGLQCLEALEGWDRP
jgi:hypothetical protein